MGFLSDLQDLGTKVSSVGSDIWNSPVNPVNYLTSKGIQQTTGVTPQQQLQIGATVGSVAGGVNAMTNPTPPLVSDPYAPYDLATSPGAQTPAWGGDPTTYSVDPSITGGVDPTASVIGSTAGVGGSVGSMNWLQQLGMGTGILGNLTGLYGASQLGKVPGQADPFAPYRGAAAQQLMALQADPSLVTKQPGYEAGLQAVERAGAAEGFTGSGNMMVALSQYGGQAYQQAIQNLMTMSGASQAPATGAQVGATATQDQFSAYTAGLNSLGATMMALGGGSKNPGDGTSSNLLFR